MSNTYPPSANDLFRAWVASHATTWAAATTIGLSAPQRTAYTNSAADLAKKWDDLVLAEADVRKAREAWRTQKSATRDLTMEDLGIIRRFALTQPVPADVYADADIPAPKVPVEGVPPGQPNQIKATLNTVNGNLKVTWKCVNPNNGSGTVYIVQRRVGTSGPWAQVAISSTKLFTDFSVPSAPIVQYQVTAQRSGLSGLTSAPVSVAFGHGPAGETVVTSVKIAA